ncbi:AAA family ATPase [Helicobacter suis]|uniref:AAA family ATPase n=1 Tax=Helicobacter suis TaxID=104628 RepID=UPI0013D0B742|nr:AAA family ATPase [Helicobacter suis]
MCRIVYRKRVQSLLADVQKGLLEREECASLMLLTMFSGKTIFLYGPPGTAKSLLARRVSTAFGATDFFAALMHRFSTPEDIFGPIDIGELKKNNLVRNTKGYLPKAHFAFLDEIWKSSPAILNTLLTILNERLFRNGGKDEHVPLRGVVCASNEFPPKNQGFEALYDRCLVRYFVKPLQSVQNFSSLIQEEEISPIIRKEEDRSLKKDVSPLIGKIEGGLEEMQEKEMSPITGKTENGFSDEDLEKIQKEARKICFSQKALDTLLEIRGTLEKLKDNPQLIASYLGITENTETEQKDQNKDQNKDQDQDLIPYVSDRRFKQCGELLKVSALLSDQKEVEVEDLVLLRHCLWDHDQQIPLIDAILRQCLKQSAHTGSKELEKIEEEFNYLEYLYKEKSPAEFKNGWQRLNAKVQDQISALKREIQERGEKANVFLSANDHKIAFLGAQEALEQARVLQLKLEEMLHDPKRVFAKRAQKNADGALIDKFKQNLQGVIPQALKDEKEGQKEAFVDKASVSLAELAQGSKSKEKVEQNLQEACLDLLSSQKLLAPLIKNLQERHDKQYSDAKEISRDFVKFLVTESFKLTDNNKMDTNQYYQSYSQAAIQAGILDNDCNYGNNRDAIAVRGITDTAYQLWQAVLSAVKSEKSNK